MGIIYLGLIMSNTQQRPYFRPPTPTATELANHLIKQNIRPSGVGRTVLKGALGFVQAENEFQQQIFDDIADNNHDPEKEATLVASGQGLASAYDKINSTSLMTNNATKDYLRSLFDKIEVD